MDFFVVALTGGGHHHVTWKNTENWGILYLAHYISKIMCYHLYTYDIRSPKYPSVSTHKAYWRDA